MFIDDRMGVAWQRPAVDYSQLASILEVDARTVSRYIDILADLLLVRCLQPWHTSVKKQLVKSFLCQSLWQGLLQPDLV